MAGKAIQLPPSQFGVFFSGAEEQVTPFGDGVRCVKTPIYRLKPPIARTASGLVLRALDFGLPPLNAGASQISAGQTWRFQFWYRDPAAGGSGFNLTDGLEVTFCP